MNASQALGYLAPEQINRSAKYNTRTALVDVYGVGMLTYFILSVDVPLANASTRVDWLDRVQAAARKCYNLAWKSTVARAANLILLATLEEQTSRPTLQEFMDEIDILIEIHSAIYPFEANAVVEELAQRIFGSSPNLRMPVGRNEVVHTTDAGIEVAIRMKALQLEIELNYVVSDGSNRTGRARYLQQSLDKAKAAVAAIADIDSGRTGIELGRSSLVFVIDLPMSINLIERISSSVSRAVADLAVRA